MSGAIISLIKKECYPKDCVDWVSGGREKIERIFTHYVPIKSSSSSKWLYVQRYQIPWKHPNGIIVRHSHAISNHTESQTWHLKHPSQEFRFYSLVQHSPNRILPLSLTSPFTLHFPHLPQFRHQELSSQSLYTCFYAD